MQIETVQPYETLLIAKSRRVGREENGNSNGMSSPTVTNIRVSSPVGPATCLSRAQLFNEYLVI